MVSASVAIEGAGNDAARPKERALARLWQNADTLSEGLVTEDGKHLRVVYPGRPNARAGPDFRDCVIQTDTGEMVTGDVELHINAPDWVHHNHHVDRNFNGVILHVVLFPKRKNFSTQQSRTVVPIASVAPVVGALERTEESSLSRANWPGNLRKTGLAKLIDRAGDQRFLGRSKGFTLDMEVVDPEEVLYRALLESLGYAANREPFRRLARQVPMATLRSLGKEPDASRLLAITAVLINAAGLMSFVQPPDQAERLSAVLKHLPRTKTMAADAWKLFRVRPANHPARRVTGAARLLDRYLEAGLVSGLEREVLRGKARMLVEGLTFRPQIGEGRAREMAVTAVLPFMHAWAGLQRDSELGRRCLELYRSFPRLADNEITREMKRLLSPELKPADLKFARRHQGLIHMYRSMTRSVQTK